MSDTLLITGSAALADQLIHAELPATVLQLRDPLYPGPAPAVRTHDEFSRVRAKFLSAQVPENYGRWWQTRLNEQEAVFEKIGEQYTKVQLWFGHRVIEQLQFTQCIARLMPLLQSQQISLSVPSSSSLGFRQFSNEDLQRLFELVEPLNELQCQLGERFWESFNERTPQALAEFASTNTQAMPYLKATTCRLLEELPNLESGLRRHESLLLQALGEQGPLSIENLLGYCLEYDDDSLTQETHVFHQLEALAKPPIQLIEGLRIDNYSQLDADQLEAYQQQTLKLTSAGRALLEHEFPLSRFRQHQFWLGGTFIHVGNMWYWDSMTQTLSGPHRRGPFFQQLRHSMEQPRRVRENKRQDSNSSAHSPVA